MESKLTWRFDSAEWTHALHCEGEDCFLVATVWMDGTWTVFDQYGNTTDEGMAPNVADGKICALMAAFNQGCLE